MWWNKTSITFTQNLLKLVLNPQSVCRCDHVWIIVNNRLALPGVFIFCWHLSVVPQWSGLGSHVWDYGYEDEQIISFISEDEDREVGNKEQLECLLWPLQSTGVLFLFFLELAPYRFPLFLFTLLFSFLLFISLFLLIPNSALFLSLVSHVLLPTVSLHLPLLSINPKL